MFLSLDGFTICLWCLNRIQYLENKMWWENEPPYLATTPHVIFVNCHLVAIIYWWSLLSIPITLGVYENTHNFVRFCCSFLRGRPYYKLVCNLGFKVRFQRCSRKGGHEMEANMVQSLPMETPNISFQTCETNFWIHFVVYMFMLFICIHSCALFQDLWFSRIKFPLFFLSL
jgi:hypothetical protein